MHGGVIYGSLIHRRLRDCHLRCLELDEHQRLQAARIDNRITAFIHASAYGYRHLYANQRLRIAVVLNQCVEKRLPHMFLRRSGNVLAAKRTI